MKPSRIQSHLKCSFVWREEGAKRGVLPLNILEVEDLNQT